MSIVDSDDSRGVELDCFGPGGLYERLYASDDVSSADEATLGGAIDGKTRRTRVMFTRLQLKHLEHIYTVQQYPKMGTRKRIGESMGISERRIQVWFQNRRAKAKREGTLLTPAHYAKFNGHAVRYKQSFGAGANFSHFSHFKTTGCRQSRDISQENCLEHAQTAKQTGLYVPSTNKEATNAVGAGEDRIKTLGYFVDAQRLFMRQLGAKCQILIKNL
eukprot:m.308235 g.308235  ORF g.308235 m.308235 type:complete len:218 (+) comp43619_c0_seq1:85-738(+)